MASNSVQLVTGAWNGTRLLVFASFTPTGADVLYDPCNDSWQSLPSNRPTFLNARKGLMGSRFAVLGLAYYGSPVPAVGAWLDEKGSHWTSIDMSGSPLGDDAANTVFAQNSVLMFSVPATGTDYDTGSRYDVATNHWKEIKTPSKLAARSNQVQTLVGNKLVVWGGEGATSEVLGDGAVYYLASDQWTIAPKSAAISWAGFSYTSRSRPTTPRPRAFAIWSPSTSPATGPQGRQGSRSG